MLFFIPKAVSRGICVAAMFDARLAQYFGSNLMPIKLVACNHPSVLGNFSKERGDVLVLKVHAKRTAI